MQDRTCLRCAGDVVRRATVGPWPSYCSLDCKQASARDLARSRPSTYVSTARPKHVASCVICGSSFLAKRLDARLCSNTCGNIERDLRGGCIVADCDRGVRAKGKCNMHYKMDLRLAGRIVEQSWNDRRRNNAQARRARMLGAGTGGSVFLAEVVERDGSRCGICAGQVDMSLVWPDPMSRSVDHIVPLSRGGIHDPYNCQLAHLRCNISKGARVA